MDKYMIYASFLLVLAVLSVCIAVTSWQHSKAGKFYSDTFLLVPLGIFVWGDGLILAPFWFVISIGLRLLSPVFGLRFFLLFWIFRAGYEVIYWIGHQWAKSEYVAPLFRKVKWIKPNDSAILYQVMNMCIAVAAAFGLLLTYTH